jgi:hypothetical protein
MTITATHHNTIRKRNIAKKLKLVHYKRQQQRQRMPKESANRSAGQRLKDAVSILTTLRSKQSTDAPASPTLTSPNRAKSLFDVAMNLTEICGASICLTHDCFNITPIIQTNEGKEPQQHCHLHHNEGAFGHTHKAPNGSNVDLSHDVIGSIVNDDEGLFQKYIDDPSMEGLLMLENKHLVPFGASLPLPSDYNSLLAGCVNQQLNRLLLAPLIAAAFARQKGFISPTEAQSAIKEGILSKDETSVEELSKEFSAVVLGSIDESSTTLSYIPTKEVDHVDGGAELLWATWQLIDLLESCCIDSNFDALLQFLTNSTEGANSFELIEYTRVLGAFGFLTEMLVRKACVAASKESVGKTSIESVSSFDRTDMQILKSAARLCLQYDNLRLFTCFGFDPMLKNVNEMHSASSDFIKALVKRHSVEEVRGYFDAMLLHCVDHTDHLSYLNLFTKLAVGKKIVLFYAASVGFILRTIVNAQKPDGRKCSVEEATLHAVFQKGSLLRRTRSADPLFFYAFNDEKTERLGIEATQLWDFCFNQRRHRTLISLIGSEFFLPQAWNVAVNVPLPVNDVSSKHFSLSIYKVDEHDLNENTPGENLIAAVTLLNHISELDSIHGISSEVARKTKELSAVYMDLCMNDGDTSDITNVNGDIIATAQNESELSASTKLDQFCRDNHQEVVRVDSVTEAHCDDGTFDTFDASFDVDFVDKQFNSSVDGDGLDGFGDLFEGELLSLSD